MSAIDMPGWASDTSYRTYDEQPTASVPAESSASSASNPWSLPSWWDPGFQSQVDSLYQSAQGRPATNPDATYLGRETGGHYGMDLAPLGSKDAVLKAITAGGAPPASAPAQTGYEDPGTNQLLQYLQDRFKSLMNPQAGSGQSIYEQYARELMAKLQQPAYSDADAQVLKANAYDSMEQERSQTKQRYMETLSRRGILPSSGIALDGLIKIDNHFDGLRAQVDRGFATQAMEAQRQNDLTALQVAAQLASSENGRMNNAYQFAYAPYQLNNDAFGRNLQLVNAGGSPYSFLNSLVGAGNYGQAVNQQQANNIGSLMQYIGFIMGM